jgi:hypothetical protein
MRTKRIEIEGTCGCKATLVRDRSEILITGRRIERWVPEVPGNLTNVRVPLYKEFTLLANARPTADNLGVARALQQNLEGCRGTNGDVDVYARLIELLAD